MTFYSCITWFCQILDLNIIIGNSLKELTQIPFKNIFLLQNNSLKLTFRFKRKFCIFVSKREEQK